MSNTKHTTLPFAEVDKYYDSTVQGTIVKEKGAIVDGKTWLLRPPKADHVLGLVSVLTEGSGVFRDRIRLGQIAMKGKGDKREIVIDGAHRIMAYKKAFNLLDPTTEKEKEAAALLTDAARKRLEALQEAIPVEVTQYESLAHALADQLDANQHGQIPVAVKDRDERIKQLYAEGMPMKQIGALRGIGLSESSVSRIIKGEQNVYGAMKGGRKPGSRNAGGVLAPKQFFKALDGIVTTLNSEAGRDNILDAVKEATDLNPLLGCAKALQDRHPMLIKTLKAIQEAKASMKEVAA